MTPFSPSLFLKRLVVVRRGLTVYDQFFHQGMNIIRGTNSHGKSTIANFIFYVLGGDISRWTPEAETCDAVFAEVHANGAILSLKREVTNKTGQPLYLYYGTYTEASKNAVNGWMSFGYRRSESGESFSQALFRALQMPDVQGDGASNITMHQLLRVIFVDQMTPVDLLMRREDFDSALIRQTVFQYLMGLFDNTLYDDQLSLREAQRHQEMTKAQLRNLERVLDKAEFETDASKLAARRKDFELELASTNIDIGTLTKRQSELAVRRKDGLKPIAEALGNLRKEAYRHSVTVEQLALETEDSRMFISSLEGKLNSLDDSILTRKTLGELTIHFCPQCLAPISASTSPSACALCKQDPGSTEALSKAARLRQEIALQIRESNIVARRRSEELEQTEALRRKVQEQIKRTQHEFDRLAGVVQTDRDSTLDGLLQLKGRLERTLDDLTQQLKVLAVVTTLRNDYAKIGVRIQELNITIKRRQDDLMAKFHEVMERVQNYTIKFIRDDSRLDYEAFFATAKELQLDLGTNTFELDKRNQFSASSVTLLKNSVHFALLFASLDLDYIRYPRLIICDNMEDKGMKPERSQNFQRAVVALSKAAKVDHQIIFTTSMIDPTLDLSEYCIGPNYTGGRKTLELEGIKQPAQTTVGPPVSSTSTLSDFKGYVAELRAMEKEDWDRAIDQKLSDAVLSLISEDTVVAEMAVSNSTGFAIEDYQVVSVLYSEEECIISISWRASGHQDGDKAFIGDRLEGLARAIINHLGDLRFENVSCKLLFGGFEEDN